MSGRHDLLRAIDARAAAGRAGDSVRVERRRQDARALACLLVPLGSEPGAPQREQHVCGDCGLTFPRQERLNEHLHYVHGAPEPPHWRRDEEGPT